MSEEDDLLYHGTPIGAVRRLIPAQQLIQDPGTAAVAEEQGRRLDFDFRDDAAVTGLLRLRRDEWDTRYRRGRWTVLPATLLCFPALAQASSLKESNDPPIAMALLGANILLILLFLTPYFWWVLRVYMSRERKNMRARCNGYRRVVQAARENGADIPRFYPHVVEMRINATYRAATPVPEKAGQ
ncbi:hypothetical protein [Streptomyces sp. ODS28]|uniref:hypothetical protein n=1 Tax=Streptomyces sp. ODS28 TaxID=3136688 RepID=UPI0031F08CD9